jgi:vitamin B12 transporter
MKKEKKIAIVMIASAALLLYRFSAEAQTDTTATPEVVITATRSEKNPEEVARSITIVSSDQIRKSGANTVAEVLSSQEGIYIVGTGQNPGQLQNVFMRGANSNQVTIMIDGVRLTDPSSTDNAIDLSELSLLDIDRIEIVRGSHSTLYGSSAIGGVINIITKKVQKPGLHSSTSLRSGTFGKGTSAFIENGYLSYTHKSGLYTSGEIYNNNTRGLDATVDTSTNSNDYQHKHREKDNFNKTDLVGKIGYRSENLNAYVSYRHVRQKADIDKAAFTDDDNYIIDLKRKLITYGAGYKLNKKISLSYIGGLTYLTRVALDDSSAVDDAGNYDHNYFRGTYKGSNSTNELQLNYQGKGITLVAGGTSFTERMTFNTYFFSSAFGIYQSEQNLDTLNIHVRTLSGFIHANLDGSILNEKYKKFGLGLGVRNSSHSLFGNNLTYEINPSIKLNGDGLLYASWTTGFNAPSLYQLYSPDKDFTSAITRGNNTLKPETSTSLEFGFKQKVNDNISYSICYFKTVVRNSIDYVYLWDKNRPVDSLSFADYRGDTYLNIGTQTNQGIEIAVSSKVSEKFYVSVNTSLISGKLDYNPSNIDNAHTQGNHVQIFANGAFLNKEVSSTGLVRRPSMANLNLTYKPTERLYIGTWIRYAGARNDVFYNSALGPFGALSTKGINDYTLVDLTAGYRIRKGLTASLRIANIFDLKYSEIFGYTSQRRGFYLNIRYSF